MSPNKKFFSGNTTEQAVLQAARHFGLEPEEVTYEEVDKRHGFLRTRRRVVISVDQEAPGRSTPAGSHDLAAPAAPPPPGPAGLKAGQPEAESTSPMIAKSDQRVFEPERFGESVPSEPEAARVPSLDVESPADFRKSGLRKENWETLSREDAKEAAGEALRRVFRLGNLSLESKIEAGTEGLEVELRGADEPRLFEDRGRMLLAIEHLLPRMIRGLTGSSVACRVDSDNFHEIRAEQLRVLAQDAAADVRLARRMKLLEPMSPDERRIVHITLADDPAVETESQGTGLFKRVAVRPRHNRPRGFDPYRR